MNIREIKVGELPEFVNQHEFDNYNVIPITKQRAYSQSHNPRSDKNDVALLIAFDEQNNVIAYAGALPDYLNGDKLNKVAWSSGWWSDRKIGKAIAIPLFLKLLETWDQKMLFAHLTPTTKQIIDKLNICDSKTIYGIRGYFQFDLHKLLPSKIPFLRHFKFLLKIIDVCINSVSVIRIALARITFKPLKLNVEYVNFIDDEVKEFIEANNADEIVKRGQDELNWVIKYPWIIKSKAKKHRKTSKYYFSSESRSFHNYCVKLYDENKLIAFLFFNEREKEFKLPYCYYNKKYIKQIVNFILGVLMQKGAKNFTVHNQDIVDYISKHKMPFLYKRKIPRFIAISKKLKGLYPENFCYQDGDGDVVFT